MNFPSYVALVAFAVVWVSPARSVVLDWSSAAWSSGTTTGSYYNDLSGAGSAKASINPLTYNFGNGLTAEVSAELTGAASWQNGVPYYGIWAPGSTNGVFALGISGANTTTGATLTFRFSQAVQLDAFRIGDLDNSGTQDLVRVGADGALYVQSSADIGPGIAQSGTSTILLTGISAPEGNFSASAPTAWTTLDSGVNWINSLTVSLSGGTQSHGIWIDNIAITSPIPEPSTYALVLGAGIFVLVVVRRRFGRRCS